ncbi:tetratricopeptide repeat protein [Chamaesiphon sp.]|uniref:tetratricopeptide repeat protein n=1 Tax=Chamaesiphon sp. TaxID=2814140 RepID=UPI003593564A
MLEQAAAALNRRDYKTAAKLIAALLVDRPDDHQIQLYAAQLAEATNALAKALAIYRLLLQQAIDPKIMAEARQGIQRIDRLQALDRASDLAVAKASGADNIEPGLLILEPVSMEHKQSVMLKFATIMNLDPYSARLQLPSRSWRLYRLGQMGELEYYRDRLQQAQIPCFCVSQHDLQQMYIFQVRQFQCFYPQATIVCTDNRAEQRTLNFNWSAVTQIVTGMLPIFEEVVETDSRNRTYRKPKILDYIYIYDLQLGDRRSILRLCSQTYDFAQSQQSRGAVSDRFTSDLHPSSFTTPPLPLTSRDNWKNLISQIHERVLAIPTQNSFAPFAETAIGYPELIGRIDPHIELLRRADSSWDRAFHLYSALAMCRGGEREKG